MNEPQPKCTQDGKSLILGLYTHLITFSIIFAAVFVCYANTLNHDFVYDDRDEMLDNPIIHSLSNIPQFFTSSTYGYYRPLRTLVWAGDYAIWEENPFGYHLTNLFLYVFACWGAYVFLTLLLDDRASALVASLLFLVHPLHTESIAWISGRGDPLAAGFLFFSIYCIIRWARCGSMDTGRRRWFLILGLLLFGCSVLSKESGTTLPVILLVLMFLNGQDAAVYRRRMFLAALFSGLVVCILTLFRYMILGSLAPSNPPIEGSLLNNAFFALTAFWRYLIMMVFPLRLYADYPLITQLILTPPIIASAIVGHLAVGVVLVALFVKRQYVYFFAVVWVYATYLPVSNVIPLNQAFSEKYMFLPSLGLCLICGSLWGTQHVHRHKAILRILICTLVVLYAARTIERNTIWKDEITLWTRTLNDQPYSAIAAYNLACEYDRLNESEQAIQYYRRAISLRQDDARQYQNLGNVYLHLNRMPEAIKCYEQALSLGLVTPHVYSSLGAAYASLGLLDQGQALVEKSLALDSSHVPGLYNLSLIFRQRGMTEEADRLFARARELNPSVATERRGWIRRTNQ